MAESRLYEAGRRDTGAKPEPSKVANDLIADRQSGISQAAILDKKAKTPRRLKGAAMDMAQRIIERHERYDYWRLRAVHCPSKVEAAF